MQILSLGMELMCKLHGFLEHLLPRGLVDFAKGLFVVVNQQQVFHVDASIRYWKNLHV
jgi:hypothetical protein